MTIRYVAALAIAPCLLSACGPQQPARVTTPPASLSPIAPEELYVPYSAGYRTAAGETWAVSLQGLLVNFHTGAARALAPTSTPHRFMVGPGVGATTPAEGTVTFAVDASGNATAIDGSSTLTGALRALRIALTQREVHFISGGDTFGATLTEPANGTHLPAIALVHGSGIQPRPLFSLWANFYATLGFAVLNYDKRGTGESGGQYPGEFPTAHALSVYADDAVAAARFLETLPEVDGTKVGFHGGSQGGWTVPLALSRANDLAFAVLVSAPAVSVDQNDFYKDLSGGSSFVPNMTDAEIDAQTVAVHGGYDPATALHALHVSTIWIYGEKDRQVPVRLSIAQLKLLSGKDLTIAVLPGGWHGLTTTPNGLASEEAASKGFGQGLFTDIADWSRAHGLTSVTL
jgi:dipeptidyl aminopeptidase/acylaminoacyl peptidase